MKILIVSGLILVLLSGCTKASNIKPSGGNYNRNYGGSEPTVRNKTIDRDEAISNNWDDIKEYLNGSETLEACSDSGDCYDLDADISSGHIETVYFSSGGNLDFYASIDESGSASDTDQDSNNWELSLDMSSSIVDDAVQEWADNNEYAIF